MSKVWDQLWRQMGPIERSSHVQFLPMTMRALIKTDVRSPQAMIASSEWVRSELGTRLGHCLASFNRLPFIAVANPFFANTYEMYCDTFQKIQATPTITTEKEMDSFCDFIFAERQQHDRTVDNLGKGLREIKSIAPDIELDPFLERLFRNRLSRRIMIEHLHGLRNPQEGWSGAIQLNCDPRKIVDDVVANVSESCRHSYALVPKVQVDEILTGGLQQGVVSIGEGENLTIACIPDHLSLMLTELLKNAMRATVEFYTIGSSVSPRDVTGNTGGLGGNPLEIFSGDDLPPVLISIYRLDTKLIFKISDKGGGIPPNKLNKIWEFGYTSTPETHGKIDDQAGALATGSGMFVNADMAGYGFGLPLSRTLARHFSGDITLQSFWGVGTDTFLTVGPIADEF